MNDPQALNGRQEGRAADHPAHPAAATPAVSIVGLCKTYASGFEALKTVSLDIRRGEILALLGPNGAGKTTLINIVCGIANATGGSVTVDGYDVVKDYRRTRSRIGLVPQEQTTDAFETVWATVSFSRGLFGKRPNPAHIEKLLRQLSLWDKRDEQLIALSGGMKRRVLIAKALSHEPEILFLDEPTAGVDVDLRRGLWALVHELRASGVTIILTTHYIEEAEQMADRIAVIDHGALVVVEDKQQLMRQLGRKRLTLHLAEPRQQVPEPLAEYDLALTAGGRELVYCYDPERPDTGVAGLLAKLTAAGVRWHDLTTQQSSLEEIFVNMVRRPA
jgi:ABC-2 type transport system ATP-binding protein